MKSVAVTGASGFVGSKAADYLESQGYTVFRYGRRPAHRIPEPARDSYTSWNIETGPLPDAPHVDAVVHCAGAVDDWGRYEPFYRANVIGTQHVLRTWPDARFVHISSASVYDPTADHTCVTEADAEPADSEDTQHVKWLNMYGKTKRMAENAVMKVAPARSVILRPHAVYGPGDTQLLPRLTQRIRFGRLIMVGSDEVRISLTHIDNFSYAIGLAIESSEIGAFNISDPTPIKLDEALKTTLVLLGKSPRVLYLPSWIIWRVSWLLEAICRFGKGPRPPITRFQLSHIVHDFVYDLSKAQKHLGYNPSIDLPAGLQTIDTPDEVDPQ